MCVSEENLNNVLKIKISIVNLLQKQRHHVMAAEFIFFVYFGSA